ncbi:dual specificity protein kinase TTK, partial [Kipferlia bialata]
CPLVVQLVDYEHIEEKNVYRIVMELGDIDLEHLLYNYTAKAEADGRPRSTFFAKDPYLCRVYWKQMLEAVDAVHERGVIHGDLKPANFISVKGQLKLIDFGIAKQMQDNTTMAFRDTAIGTLNYMAPEVVQAGVGGGRECRRASDVWSLGCMLYHMVYGQTPFAKFGKNQFAKMNAIVGTPINGVVPAIQFPKTDNTVVDTLRKCLDRKTQGRAGIAQLLTLPFIVPTSNAINKNTVKHAYVRVLNVLASQLEKRGEDGERVPVSDEEKQLFFKRMVTQISSSPLNLAALGASLTLTD